MRAAVDSAVVLDVLLDDPEFGERSMRLIEHHLGRGAVTICPVAFSESAACLEPPSGFIDVCEGLGFSYEDFDPEVCSLAAQLWRDYRARGGSRRRILADFLIGAHAMLRADCLLTRDRGFYRTYFKGLEIEEP